MMKLLFYIIIFILAAFVGLLVDHYLHSPGMWHCLMGIEFCGNGIFPERESRGLTLPIFLDGVPWDRDRLHAISRAATVLFGGKQDHQQLLYSLAALRVLQHLRLLSAGSGDSSSAFECSG